MDKIIVSGLEIFAYHGVNDWEREDGQTFVLDVEGYADLSAPCLTDNLNETLNYSRMIKNIRQTMLSEKNKLIERAAQRVADGLLAEFPAMQSVKVRLRKPDAPVKADFDFVAVEIERKRSKI